MFVLNKKRLIFINLIIVTSVFYYSLFFNNNSETELTSSTPVANHTIILDAGHGNPDRWCCRRRWFY